MFAAGNISVGELSFNPPETASVQAEEVARLGNIIRNVSLTRCPSGPVERVTAVLLLANCTPNKRCLVYRYEFVNYCSPASATSY